MALETLAISKTKSLMNFTDMKGLRAEGYIRDSTLDQKDGFGPDIQRHNEERFAQLYGLNLGERWYTEFVSGRRADNRHEFQKFLEDARLDKFDVLLVDHTSRFGRNQAECISYKKELQRLDKIVIFVSQGIISGSDRDFLSERINETLDEQYSRNLSRYVTDALIEKVEHGLYVGPIPFGYKNQLDKKLPPIQVIKEAEAVKEAAQQRVEGRSYGEIATWLNNQGFRTREGHVFTAHAVKDMLNNHFYCGYVKYKDKEYPGKHEAVISEEIFNRVQSRRQRREILRSVHGPKGLLQGMIACARCGRPIQSDRHRQQIPLYRERHANVCPTNNTSAMANVIDKQINRIVFSLELEMDWRRRMAELAVKNTDGPDPIALKEKRRRLGKAYADGAFSDAEYARRKAEIDIQLSQAITVTTPDIEQAVELFSDIPMLWLEANIDERRTLVRTLIETAYVDLEMKLVTAIRPTPAFRTLFGVGIKTPPDAPVGLEPFKHGNEGIVGVGGDGGAFNFPNSKTLSCNLKIPEALATPIFLLDTFCVHWKA